MNKEQIVEILACAIGSAYIQGATNKPFDLKPEPFADEILALQIVEDRGWYNNIEFNCPVCSKRIAVPVEKPPKEGADMTTDKKHEFALELVRTGQIGAKTYNVIYAYLCDE